MIPSVSSLVSADVLRTAGTRIFGAVGAPDEIAARVAHSLVDANLAGHDSHGVIRIPSYVRAVRAGEVIPHASPELVRETEVSAMVDGGWAFGQLTAERATRVAMDKARRHGIAVVAAVRCTHIGRLGEYAEMGAAEGLIVFVAAGGLTGKRGQVAPYGGRRGVLGTNPLAFGFPGGSEDVPVLLADFATSAVAAGKIMVARAKGAPLPPGSIQDAEGRPSTQPQDYVDGGSLLPFGGHKGYGLMVVVELLGRVLTGSSAYAEDGRGGDVYGQSGTLVLAMDPGLFRDAAEYARDADATLRRIKAIPPAPGFDEVLLPGEPERQSRSERTRSGIPVEDTTLEAIRETAQSLGLPRDLLL
jgi:LDH2 family malate/lactate/ureidoglycolate dehydrogenase